MPVIPQLSQVVKMGKTMSGGLSAEASATIDAVSQAQIAGPSLQPIPFLPGTIPVIPFGIALSITMTKIEAMMFKSFEDLSSITKTLMQKYETDKTKAETKRKTAETQLYNDLISAQNEIKTSLTTDKETLEIDNTSLEEIAEKQETEMAEYTNIIFNIKDAAKKAEDENNITERDKLIASINNYDIWLAEILKLSVEIINLKLEITSLEAEIEEYTELASITITTDWDTNIELADSFNVSVPAYPDLPDLPELPTVPPTPKESEFIKAQRKAFCKWCVTPTILPIGMPLAATLLYIQSQAPVPPKMAAKLESSADAAILQGAGLI